jgi:hypothetical protein
LIGIINKQPDEPVGDIFVTHFGEVKDNIEQKFKKVMGSG